MAGKGKIDVVSQNKKIKIKRGNVRNTLWKLYTKEEVKKDEYQVKGRCKNEIK